MPIEFGFWRIDQKIREINFEPMTTESRLEEILDSNITIAAPHLMVIGRQVRTSFDKVIDLLAIDVEGNLSVIELKKDKTYRDIVSQVLDYGSWVRTLRDEDIARIYHDYVTTWHPDRQASSINDTFCKWFKVKAMPEELNSNHELIIVAGAFDPSTERIVTYLAEHHDVSINAVFFRFFKDGEREYLSRVWLREPSMTATEGRSDGVHSDWNGEYYVSFGINDTRDWNEAVKYGFISGGGGPWYSNTLSLLEPGARVWVNIPATGYVGVGQVIEGRVPVEEFMTINDAGGRVPITTLPLKIATAMKSADNPDKAEYLVGVSWLKTVPVSQAIKERGFFGNQNTVARPTTEKWNHTVERLKTRFGID
ncbi:MAG TPA: hypothetical protein VMT62_10535 [Syntrophorhabdaceae bacterium]|nr:hypothetical protein [Syntrophorhabdaceae bacterium]